MNLVEMLNMDVTPLFARVPPVDAIITLVKTPSKKRVPPVDALITLVKTPSKKRGRPLAAPKERRVFAPREKRFYGTPCAPGVGSAAYSEQTKEKYRLAMGAGWVSSRTITRKVCNNRSTYTLNQYYEQGIVDRRAKGPDSRHGYEWRWIGQKEPA